MFVKILDSSLATADNLERIGYVCSFPCIAKEQDVVLVVFHIKDQLAWALFHGDHWLTLAQCAQWQEGAYAARRWAASASAACNSMQNVLPRFGSLSRVIRPCIFSTTLRTNANPIPVPLFP